MKTHKTTDTRQKIFLFHNCKTTSRSIHTGRQETAKEQTYSTKGIESKNNSPAVCSGEALDEEIPSLSTGLDA